MELTQVREAGADGAEGEYVLNLGPQHPSTHGVLRLVLRLDGETVLEAVPHLGYIHRGIEKMGENQTYLQYLHLTDRMDYLSSHSNNLGVCLAVEKALGMGVPERGEYIRVMVLELQRLQSHLLWWGCLGMDLGAVTAFLYGFKERERITALFEEVCGARLTSNYFRPGGCAEDVPDTFLPRVREISEAMKRFLGEMDALLTGNPVIRERTRGVGALSAERAVAYGCSGPVARASGVDYDARRDDPYSLYPEFPFRVPVGSRGDCLDRYLVRLEEMRESVGILERAAARFPSGPHRSKEKAVIKLPPGAYHSMVETPRGLFGTWIVSDGGTKPWRIKNRSPNLSNLAALPELARGCKLGDLVAIISTLDIIIPDMDR